MPIVVAGISTRIVRPRTKKRPSVGRRPGHVIGSRPFVNEVGNVVAHRVLRSEENDVRSPVAQAVGPKTPPSSFATFAIDDWSVIGVARSKRAEDADIGNETGVSRRVAGQRRVRRLGAPRTTAFLTPRWGPW